MPPQLAGPSVSIMPPHFEQEQKDRSKWEGLFAPSKNEVGLLPFSNASGSESWTTQMSKLFDPNSNRTLSNLNPLVSQTRLDNDAPDGNTTPIIEVLSSSARDEPCHHKGYTDDDDIQETIAPEHPGIVIGGTASQLSRTGDDATHPLPFVSEVHPKEAATPIPAGG